MLTAMRFRQRRGPRATRGPALPRYALARRRPVTLRAEARSSLLPGTVSRCVWHRSRSPCRSCIGVIRVPGLARELSAGLDVDLDGESCGDLDARGLYLGPAPGRSSM